MYHAGFEEEEDEDDEERDDEDCLSSCEFCARAENEKRKIQKATARAALDARSMVTFPRAGRGQGIFSPKNGEMSRVADEESRSKIGHYIASVMVSARPVNHGGEES